MAGALIGALRVSLSAETSAFEAGMKRSQRTAQSTANSIKNSFGSIRGEFGLLKTAFAGFVGALSVGSLLAAGKAALDYAGSLGETAQQLGVTTRDLQAFRYAAGQVGVGQEQLETGLSKLTVTLGRVAAGAKAPAAALNAIGVSVDQLKGKDTGEAFRIIADGLEKIPDRAQRAAVEVALFGKSGAQLDNLLSGGSKQVNELAKAAEELGIVLSDAQIQKANDTADKLEALQTVLKSQIAGVVADNADAILGLADAIARVAREAFNAIGYLKSFYAQAQKVALQTQNNLSQQFDLIMPLFGRKTRAQNRASNEAQIRALDEAAGAARFGALFRGRPKSSSGGGNIGQFLASGGGGGRSRSRVDRSAEEAERKRLEALRDANQFDQEIRRAKIDTLNSQKQIAEDYVAQRNIGIQILEAERASYDAQLAYEVASGEKTQVQADQLKAERDLQDAIQVQALNAEEEAQRREDVARLADVDYQNQRTALQVAYDLADTQKERRDLALRMVDLDYRYEKARLETIMAEEKVGSLKWEEARRQLEALNKRQPGVVQGAMNQTRGPLEDYLHSADDFNSQIEGVAVDGLKKFEDGLTGIIMGTKSVKEAFHDMATAILEDLIRIIIRQLIVRALLAAFGGGFSGGGAVGDVSSGAIGMASGGFVSGPGGSTADRIPAMLSNGEYVVNAKATRRFLPFLEKLNSGSLALATGGLTIPRATYGERARYSNSSAMNGGTVNHFDLRGAVMTEDLLKQMNEMAAKATDDGANLGVRRVRDMNERTFGRSMR